MSEEQEIFYHVSHTPGLSGTTPCVAKRRDDGKIEVRMGFALFGSTQMDEAGFKACDHNPFHPDFFDNYAEGIGDTEEEAIAQMKASLNSIYESIWV